VGGKGGFGVYFLVETLFYQSGKGFKFGWGDTWVGSRRHASNFSKEGTA